MSTSKGSRSSKASRASKETKRLPEKGSSDLNILELIPERDMTILLPTLKLMAQLYAAENVDLVVYAVRDEIIANVMEEIHSKYMKQQEYRFVVHCTIEALRRFFNIYFYWKEAYPYYEGYPDWTADTAHNPSKADTWAAYSVPIREQEMEDMEPSEEILQNFNYPSVSGISFAEGQSVEVLYGTEQFGKGDATSTAESYEESEYEEPPPEFSYDYAQRYVHQEGESFRLESRPTRSEDKQLLDVDDFCLCPKDLKVGDDLSKEREWSGAWEREYVQDESQQRSVFSRTYLGESLNEICPPWKSSEYARPSFGKVYAAEQQMPPLSMPELMETGPRSKSAVTRLRTKPPMPVEDFTLPPIRMETKIKGIRIIEDRKIIGSSSKEKNNKETKKKK